MKLIVKTASCYSINLERSQFFKDKDNIHLFKKCHLSKISCKLYETYCIFEN